MSYGKWNHSVGLLLSVLLVPVARIAGQDEALVAYPDALEAAAVSVDQLDSILDDALILGNGDLNALVHIAAGQLQIKLTKNDVWDARFDAKLDPPLPKFEWVKKLAAVAPVHGGRSTILQDGWGNHGQDAYHAHAYPCQRAIRDVALFQADFMAKCRRTADGRIVLGPSVSPEHWAWTKDFARNRNGTFDIAVFRYVFQAAIEGSIRLDCDASLRASWQAALEQLPEYPTTDGEQPVVVDVLGAPPITYNIAVPAVPVFPGDVVTWLSPPAERELFARTIDGCAWNGNNSVIILAVARARLSMPGTIDWLRSELQYRSRPNGTLTLNRLGHGLNAYGHYTEQFAASMAVSELLLQSVGDTIRVFPAWPMEKRAEFRDLRAQGGFLVSSAMTDGAVKRVDVTSTVGGRLRILSPWQEIGLTRNGKAEAVALGEGRVVVVETNPDDRLVFTPGAASGS